MSGDKTEVALREAARWYAELQDDGAGPDLWRRFQAWERRPGNAAAFRQVEAALRTLDRARASAGAQRARPRWPVAAGIAAALLLAVLGGALVMGREATTVPAVLTYATGTGEQEAVSLADGSRIVLNTASRVEVSFSDAERRIVLAEGQALFEVRREARPFVVAAGGAETRALGTRFDVYLPAGEGLRVTLLEGLVSVSGESAGGNVILSPGEQMTLLSGKRTVARVDVSRAESWTTGMVAFTDETLAGAADELNRYSDIKLRVDAAIAGERISGSFRAGDQDAFAAALESFMPVVAERRGDEIVIHAQD
ncbi:MAG: iron dicitrate transport regulator FecR [Hyphomonas sp.]|uniref:FecR family protein n=1 Tax=Hyphomonas sp. TaxID=87 RepID=UPI0025BA113F|nr:FecR domain-containing protein [Hyphomonas sp.]MBA4338959.1 iron dicitrate transport regulator FecR [Hyphomonas sp.]